MIQLEQEIPFEVNDELKSFIKLASEEIVKHQMSENMAPLKKPTLNYDLSGFVILNNLPSITLDKQQKLTQVLKQILIKQQLGEQFTDVIINLTGQGLVKFISEEAASKGARVIDGFALDKTHQLQAFPLKEFEQILQTSDTYHPLKLKPIKKLQDWITDPQIRDQVVLVQDKTKLTLQWFQHLENKFLPITEELIIPSTDNLEWSKRGTYLVIYTKEGFELYGGSYEIEHFHSFAHPGCLKVNFSNDEEYAISYNGTSAQTESTENFIVWKIREETKIRAFRANQLDLQDTIQFSPDSKWLAKIENDFLSFYQSPNFYLFDKKLNIPNIQNYIWVEKTNFVCYASCNGSQRDCDKTNQKSLIMFVEVPSKREIKWRNIQFDCDQCDLFSNTNGKWVCAIMKKRVKRKVVSTVIQLANFRKPDMGIEFINEELQEEVEKIYFEQRTGKIALQYRDKDKSSRAVEVFHFKFYAIDEGKSLDLKDMGTYMNKETNEVLWSNNGTYFAFVNKLKGTSDQGKIEFGMVLKKTTKDSTTYNIEITKTSIHYYMSHAAWDPSGSYFITMSDQQSSIIVWSAIGEQLVRDTITKLNYINWRMIPTNITNEKQELQLYNTSYQKDYMKRYEEDDDKVINRAKHEKEEKRQKQNQEFTALLAAKKQKWQSVRAQRKDLLNFDTDDRTKLIQIQIVEREELVEQEKV